VEVRLVKVVVMPVEWGWVVPVPWLVASQAVLMAVVVIGMAVAAVWVVALLPMPVLRWGKVWEVPWVAM
jgi:hypothetical protein